MDAQTLATILLILRIIAVVLLSVTIARQIHQFRNTVTDYPGLRIAIFIATVVLLIGQFIPIALDAVVEFGETYSGRSVNPTALPVSYSLNNAIKDVIIGALLAVQHNRPRRK